MSEINAPIQIPSELNVPETANENDKTEPIKPKSAIPGSASQSTDASFYPKHRLRKESKSQSMFNFTDSKPTTKKENDQHGTVAEQPPAIAIYKPSAKSRRSAEQKSNGSLIQVNNLTEQPGMREISASTNEMQLSVSHRRANSLAPSEHKERDNDEFDELGPNVHTGSQLRIRSSIISLFGRMGKMRRTSNNSTNENGDSNNRPSLRMLPQIAATKIMRAFSYVGKHTIST